MEIRKEIPAWSIDWVNKIYTLINDVDYIDDIFIDWAIYTDFSVVWKIITLTDAPTLSIYVDYKTTSSSTVVSSWVTLWQIITEVYRLSWQTSNSTKFSRSVVVDLANSLLEQVWNWKVTNILTQQIYKAWNLWFQNSFIGYRINWGWTISAEVNIWDAIIEMDTTSLLSAWYVRIWSDIIKYTSKTDTQLNWVSGITVNHLIADKVKQLYVLPTDFEKPDRGYKIIESDSLQEVEIPYKLDNQYWVCYSIIRSDIQLLEVFWLYTDDQVKLNYVKEYEELVNDSDVCILPKNYWKTIIARLTAWELMYDYSMPSAERILNVWYWKLNNMYWNYTNPTKNSRNAIKPISYNFSSIR